MSYPTGFKDWPSDKRNEWWAAENKRLVAQKCLKDSQHSLAPQMAHERAAEPAGVNLLSAASVTEAVDWLWPGYLARDKLHLLAGAPGTGKTTLALRMAAIVSVGGKWPDGSQCLPGNVVIWSGEDGVADTLVPRLRAAGADVNRCYFVESVRAGGGARPFDPGKDFPALQSTIASIGGASLLICDPVVSAITADSHKNTEVRRGLQPLVELANKVQCAIIGITHFSKGTGGRDPVERITGSIAFGAVARVVLVTAREVAAFGNTPSDRRLFVRAKSNIGPDGDGFSYSLTSQELRSHEHIEAAVANFGEPLTGSAKSLLASAEVEDTGAGGALREAKDFLRDLLVVGPVPAKDCKRQALDAGITGRTLDRAKQALGVCSVKSAMSGGWEWCLGEERQE